MFPNIQRLPAIYITVPQLEANVERGFSKMTLILNKKRTALDNYGSDALMRLSYRKEKIDREAISTIVDSWKKTIFIRNINILQNKWLFLIFSCMYISFIRCVLSIFFFQFWCSFISFIVKFASPKLYHILIFLTL